MIGYHSFNSFNVTWRTLPYGLAPLSPPASIPSSFNHRLAKSLLSLRKRILYIRWETDFDSSSPTQWWHIINDNPSSTNLSAYKPKVRNSIRRANSRFTCTLATRDKIASECYSVYSLAHSSYETHESKLTPLAFKHAIYSLHPNTDFWIVTDNRTQIPVAFSENYVDQNTCFYNTIWLDPHAKKQYCAYSLFYHMNKYYLQDLGLSYVSDGARSLSHDTNIHQFLLSKFGFRYSFSQLSVVYYPVLRIFLALLCPLRNFISLSSSTVANKLSILLRLEEVRQSFSIR